MREPILAAKHNGRSLVHWKELQRVHEIVFQGGVDGLRIVLGLEFCFVDPDQFLSFPGLLAETVIGNAIKPGGEFRFTPKAANVSVSAQKSFLSQIIGQRQITSGELAQKAADGRLMVADQFSEGVMIIFKKNPCNKVGVT